MTCLHFFASVCVAHIIKVSADMEGGDLEYLVKKYFCRLPHEQKLKIKSDNAEASAACGEKVVIALSMRRTIAAYPPVLFPQGEDPPRIGTLSSGSEHLPAEEVLF